MPNDPVGVRNAGVSEEEVGTGRVRNVFVGNGAVRNAGVGKKGVRRGRRQRGSVTAEFAIALPAVILVLAMSLLGLQAMARQLQLQDAAAIIAQAAARGDPRAASAVGSRTLLAGTRYAVSRNGDLVCATLTTPAVSGALSGVLEAMTLRATSCALALRAVAAAAPAPSVTPTPSVTPAAPGSP